METHRGGRRGCNEAQHLVELELTKGVVSRN